MCIVNWSIFSFILIVSMQESKNNLTVEIADNIFFSSQYLLKGNVVIKNKIDVENLIANIICKYADAGFPFCRIYPKTIYSSDTVEKVILNIEEGERVIISDYLFNIQGTSAVNAVKKVANPKKGSYFSSKEIERSKRDLLKTGAFEDISDNIICRDGNYYLVFSLKEKRSDYFTAFGSLAEDNYNFSISFYSLNLLGSLRRLQFCYEYQKLFSLQFTEPILIFPTAVNGNFSLWTYDSVRLIQFNAEITAPFGRYFKFSLMSGIESISYFGSDSAAKGHTDNIIGTGFSLDREALNWYCRQNITFEYLFRQYDRWRIQYDSEFDINKFIIKPHYYVAKTDSFEYFDYFRIGGVKNLRGYLEEEFIVPDAMWLNIEYKKFFIFPLFDIALLQNNIKFSYGLGIEAKSEFADASLLFAWPKQGTWQDGKIHLTLETGF